MGLRDRLYSTDQTSSDSSPLPSEVSPLAQRLYDTLRGLATGENVPPGVGMVVNGLVAHLMKQCHSDDDLLEMLHKAEDIVSHIIYGAPLGDCETCGGNGVLSDDSGTGAVIPCPTCQGNGAAEADEQTDAEDAPRSGDKGVDVVAEVASV